MKMIAKIIIAAMGLSVTLFAHANPPRACDGQLPDQSSPEDVKFVLDHDRKSRLDVQANSFWAECANEGYDIETLAIPKDNWGTFSCDKLENDTLITISRSVVIDRTKHMVQLTGDGDSKCFEKINFSKEAVFIKEDAIKQANLFVYYYQGKNVPQNYAIALQWLQKSAKQGYVKAQGWLAAMYDKGDKNVGISQDYSAAMLWYRKAADQGNDIAQLNLGVLYASGHGVPINDALAIQWYRKAAAQGNVNAKRNLEIMNTGSKITAPGYAPQSGLTNSKLD